MPPKTLHGYFSRVASVKPDQTLVIAKKNMEAEKGQGQHYVEDEEIRHDCKKNGTAIEGKDKGNAAELPSMSMSQMIVPIAPKPDLAIAAIDAADERVCMVATKPVVTKSIVKKSPSVRKLTDDLGKKGRAVSKKKPSGKRRTAKAREILEASESDNDEEEALTRRKRGRLVAPDDDDDNEITPQTAKLSLRGSAKPLKDQTVAKAFGNSKLSMKCKPNPVAVASDVPTVCLVDPMQFFGKKSETKVMPVQPKAAGLLSPMTFVVTGEFDDISTSDCIELIEKHGGRLSKRIDADVKFLVCGNGGDSIKISQAEDARVPLIGLSELRHMIQNDDTVLHVPSMLSSTPNVGSGVKTESVTKSNPVMSNNMVKPASSIADPSSISISVLHQESQCIATKTVAAPISPDKSPASTGFVSGPVASVSSTIVHVDQTSSLGSALGTPNYQSANKPRLNVSTAPNSRSVDDERIPLSGSRLVLPVGQLGCLSGRNFVITGIFDGINRTDCADLIKKYGGSVTNAVSGATTHLVVGSSESGEKKLRDARDRGVSIIDLNDLFSMIRTGRPVPDGKPILSTSTTRPAPKSASKSSNLLSKMASSTSTDTPQLSLMWVDKYKPQTADELCANPGLVSKLITFLKQWNPASPIDNQRAALLSGPPGIGKSTAAAICAREAGYDIVEFNASNTRSKKSIQQTVSELVDSHSISEYFADKGRRAIMKPHHKTVLIMDEVDGMSSGDRGGMTELVKVIKSSKVPIICICNDRSSPKVKTLANYCLDLRFRRPMASQVVNRLMKIANNEGLALDVPTLNKIVESTRGDIRQILNTLQLWSTRSSSVSFDEAKASMEAGSKDFASSPFDMAPNLFHTVNEQIEKDWLTSRMDIYYGDSSLVPLLVQSSYLNCIPALTPQEQSSNAMQTELAYLSRYTEAADAISMSDMIGNEIHSGQNWTLMPLHAVMSSVAPSFYVAGRLQGRVEFPVWFGKNSTSRKNARLISELHSHMSGHARATDVDVCLDYLPALRQQVVIPLSRQDDEAIDSVLSIMEFYHLSRDDFQSITELGQCFQNNKLHIETKTKTAFTKAFNKKFGSSMPAKKKRVVTSSMEDKLIGDEEAEMSEEDAEEEPATEDVAPIKPKKAPAKRQATSRAPGTKKRATASSSSSKTPAKKKKF